jgi:hypothetical protein
MSSLAGGLSLAVISVQPYYSPAWLTGNSKPENSDIQLLDKGFDLWRTG